LQQLRIMTITKLLMKGTEVPNPRRSSACDCTCVSTRNRWHSLRLPQWRIQRGFHGFHGTPLLKGCLRKYYVQTYYATHFGFTVAITDVYVHSIISCIRNLTRARPTSIYYYTWQPQRQWAKRESELKQRFYSCIDHTAARLASMLSVWEHFFSRALCG